MPRIADARRRDSPATGPQPGPTILRTSIAPTVRPGRVRRRTTKVPAAMLAARRVPMNRSRTPAATAPTRRKSEITTRSLAPIRRPRAATNLRAVRTPLLRRVLTSLRAARIPCPRPALTRLPAATTAVAAATTVAVAELRAAVAEEVLAEVVEEVLGAGEAVAIRMAVADLSPAILSHGSKKARLAHPRRAFSISSIRLATTAQRPQLPKHGSTLATDCRRSESSASVAATD